MRKGKGFEDRVLNALRRYGFAYKFRDYAVNPHGAYKVPVPSDILFLHSGKAYFLECKEFHGTRFYKSKIREAQWKYGEQIVYEGIPYKFLIHAVDYNVIFVVDYNDLLHEFADKKSLKIDELQRYPCIQDKRFGAQLVEVLTTKIL